MDSHRSPVGPARRWPVRLVAVLWPLALAGAVALAIVESRSDGPAARADAPREAPALPRPAVSHLVKPKAGKPRHVRVPDVVGFRPKMAKRALGRRDLDVMAFGRESLLPSGTVVDQSPQPGKRVRRGRKVRLYLAISASGRMPEVIGHDVARAASDLWAVGLQVKFAYRRVHAPERDGTVLAQSPPSGTDVHDGEAVWLLIARR